MSKIRQNITPQFPIRSLEERALERLRQEKETFDQRKRQDRIWFILRLTLGYFSIVVFGIVLFFSCYILFNNQHFSNVVVKYAAIFAFADLTGVVLCVWKIVFNQGSVAKLEPVTKDHA